MQFAGVLRGDFLLGSYEWRKPRHRCKDAQLFHTRTSAPSIQGNRWSHRPLFPSNTQYGLQHAAKAQWQTVCTRCSDSGIKNGAWRADTMRECEKQKQISPLPSRSHNCMASRLRSLIIPSQGLNGLVMLCAKPGTSISAEEPGWCYWWWGAVAGQISSAGLARPTGFVCPRSSGKKGRERERERENGLSSQSVSQPTLCSFRRSQLSSLSPGWCG